MTRWIEKSELTRRLCAVLGIVAVGVLSGCNLYFDVDSVDRPGPITESDTGDAGLDATRDADADATDTSDVADTADAPEDAGDADASPDAADTSDAADTADTADADTADAPDNTLDCRAEQGQIVGECNPATQQGCNAGQFCTLTLVITGGTPDRFEAQCQNRSAEGSQTVGQGCASGGDCAEGLYCVSWEAPEPRGHVCSKICDMNTGEGCSADELCTNPYGDLLDGLGFCTPRCDPADTASCAGSSACAADPNYSADACLPEYRCLNNGGYTGKQVGDACDTSRLDLDGCPTDLVCAPAPGDPTQEVCQRPCAADADCPTSGTCANGPSPWDFAKFCEL